MLLKELLGMWEGEKCIKGITYNLRKFRFIKWGVFFFFWIFEND